MAHLKRRVEKVSGLSMSVRPFFLLSLSVGAALKRADIEIEGWTDFTNLIGVFRDLPKQT